MAIGLLMSVMTMSFALPFDFYESLEFGKYIVHKEFILTDIKSRLYLPLPSRKQSTFFISSKSNLFF